VQIYKDWEDGYDMKLHVINGVGQEILGFLLRGVLCCDFIKEWTLDEFMTEATKRYR
jgi:hypothetical protein